MKKKRITVNDLRKLEAHSGSEVIAYTTVPRQGEREYHTSIGYYTSASVWLANLVGYLYGLSYVAIRDGRADPLPGNLVDVTKEAQRRDAAYFEEGRNRAINENTHHA